jgi:hypothetical protein
MNKFSNLNICSTKREPNPQWPLTDRIGLNFWSEVGSPIPMTSQWPQTAFARLLLICSLILDLSSTGLIKKRGTQCFSSRKREPCTNDLHQPQFLIKYRCTYPNDLKQPLFLLFLICSLLFDLSTTGVIKKRGTKCFISSKRKSYPWHTSQKFKPNPNEIFLRSKNILAWVRFKFLGNQAFLRGCGGLPPLGSANRIWLG